MIRFLVIARDWNDGTASFDRDQRRIHPIPVAISAANSPPGQNSSGSDEERRELD
jgi:hypothetical protein